jgi:small subunit ribosomal protein S1
MKQIEPNPWTLLRDKYPVGSRITGKVKNITDFGIFVGVEEGIDGLVHISDLSWTLRVKHPSDLYQKGDEVEAVVLHIDVENERFSLGIKQLIEDPWDRIPTQYPMGRILDVKILRVQDWGGIVELEKGIEGVIPVNEIAEERVEDPRTVLKETESIRAEIVHVDIIERRITLSLRAAQRSADRAEAQPYLEGGKPTTQLGELLKERLEKGQIKVKGKKEKKEKEG